MSVPIFFANMDIRRTSMSPTVSGPEVAALLVRRHAEPPTRWALHVSERAILFCLINRRISHSSAYSGAPETTDQIMSATSQQFFGLEMAMVTHQSAFSICGLSNVILLAQEVILAHSATPGCCFDHLMSMAPNNVRPYISDMSACKQYTDPETVFLAAGKR